jgi:hypothetical protein
LRAVTKVLAARVPVAHRVIHPCQTGFIRGRHILEGIVVIHEVKVKKLSAIMLKLDFEKAYDRVDWKFLKDVLLKKGFSVSLVELVTRLFSMDIWILT